MKKLGKTLLLVLLGLIAFSQVSAIESKVSMELWSRYTADLNGSEISKSYFSLERGYFGVEPAFSDKIKGRFTLDFFSSDKFEDGVGIKLKYAYIDFAMPLRDMSLQAGLIKTYFGTIYDWSYPTIQKSFDDKEKIVSSADYGISVNGLIPAGFGEYALSIYNGEGYNKTGGNIDANPAFAFNLRVIPLTGITLGGSVLYEDHSLLVDADTTISDTLRLVYTGVGRIAFGFLDIWAQYAAKDMDGNTGTGLMVMPILKINKLTSSLDMEIVGRYDTFDKNREAGETDDSYSRIIAGFNWNILKDANDGKPVIFVQTNWERTMYEDTTKDALDNVSVQLRYLFTGKM
ncbi:MAG: hypothetical protein AB7T10_08355 [bacterium]